MVNLLFFDFFWFFFLCFSFWWILVRISSCIPLCIVWLLAGSTSAPLLLTFGSPSASISLPICSLGNLKRLKKLETWKLRNWETGKLGNRETWKLSHFQMFSAVFSSFPFFSHFELVLTVNKFLTVFNHFQPFSTAFSRFQLLSTNSKRFQTFQPFSNVLKLTF